MMYVHCRGGKTKTFEAEVSLKKNKYHIIDTGAGNVHKKQYIIINCQILAELKGDVQKPKIIPCLHHVIYNAGS